MDKTIKQLIDERRGEIGNATSLTPHRAAEILLELTNLLGNVLEQIRQTEVAYNLLLLRCYEQETKANRAKILAETSKEYTAKCEARDTKEIVTELCRSLKYLLRSYEDERQTYGNWQKV